MSLSKEEFQFHEVKSWLIGAVNLYLVGEHSHPRVRWLANQLAGTHARFVSFQHGPGAEELYITITDLNTGVREPSYACNLMTDLPRILRDLDIRGSKVCVDVSGMWHPLIFLVCRLLTMELTPQQLFASYVLPQQYYRTQHDGPFDLSEEFRGIRSLPGFLRRASSEPPALLVAFLGFEGLPLSRILDELGSRPKRILPVFGFPGFEAGWKTLALEQNMPVMESNHLHGEMTTCEASSVFEAYGILQRAHWNAREGQVIVCPLGTRPHALASALYASTHPGVSVLYDHPVEKRIRSQDIRGCKIYHLSRFCRRV